MFQLLRLIGPLLFLLLALISHTSAQQNTPPSNGLICFVSDRDGNLEIYVMNADGSNLRRLTFDPAKDEDPDWSPDGTQIVFSSFRTGSHDIFVMNDDGTGVINLTPDSTAGDFSPVWSPDGTRIAFSRTITSGYDLWVMNADGTNLVKLVDGNGTTYNLFPTWSPDGQRIAFVSTEKPVSPREFGSYSLMEINLATGNLEEISKLDTLGTPDWSWTNNTLLSFGPAGYSGTVLQSENSSGDFLATLTLPPNPEEGERYDSYPAWSPDGTRIVFQSQFHSSNSLDASGHDFDIFVIDADGTGLINLTPDNTANDTWPDWQPVIRQE
ncbi:MAG TPA: hypothetical protein VHP83_22800 [Aggregatilineaceae bacterium]|nr:hypothetical protein [Aggregatilineaceae bacterium]